MQLTTQASDKPRRCGEEFRPVSHRSVLAKQTTTVTQARYHEKSHCRSAGTRRERANGSRK